jgi:FolB domain-containing protein
VPNEPPLPDEIHIEQLDVFTRIGVPEEERANPQKLTANISFWPSQQIRHLGDDIERAVDYSAVAAETKKFVRNQSVSLVETLADRLADHLLASFPIQKVTIELRKFALKDATYISVTITRTACVG